MDTNGAKKMAKNRPVKFPLAPMEARLVRELPQGEVWQYEPKWDGFRCLVFRDGEKVILQSKAGKPLGRYFPELVAALLKLKAPRYVLDGEIIVSSCGRGDFSQLLQRIHPSASRILKLSHAFPATLMVFDLLSEEKDVSFLNEHLSFRRSKLEAFARRYFTRNPRVRLSPAARTIAQAGKWLARQGAFFDGIVAKRLDAAYAPGKRTAMEKFKPIRTADCVVGGFRYGKGSPYVGSLLLGLYENGLLHHVGFASGLKASERRALTARLRVLIKPPGFTGHAPGGPSRWSTERSAQWQPLRPKLVVEVSFDHVTDKRFRHGTKIIRWRPDKSPAQCTMEQILPGSRNTRNRTVKKISKV